MFVRQLFNQNSFSYTYLVADQVTMEAVLIDPVKEKLRDYVQLFNELGLTAIAAIDTHQHDDRNSALGALRDLWGCDAIAGAPTEIAGLTRTVQDGSVIPVGKTDLIAIHTPGHSVDSYSYLIEQPGKISVFTGDTLLVRTLGLSNQKTSDIETHYHSLFNVLLQLPDETLIYPGRDFKGWPLSTIAEEKAFNPYLQVESLEQFMELKQSQKAADTQALVKANKTITGDRFKLEGSRVEVRGDNPATPLDQAAGLPDWR